MSLRESLDDPQDPHLGDILSRCPGLFLTKLLAIAYFTEPVGILLVGQKLSPW